MNSDLSKSPTISIVARQLGLSPSLVSLAFSGKGSLSAGRREEVVKAARELGYEPNPLAQRLKMGRSQNTIAIYSPALEPGVTIHKVQHMQSLLDARGFTVELHAHPYQTEHSGQPLLKTLRQEKPRAIIANAGWNFGVEDIAELEGFQAEGGVVVCMSYTTPVQMDCDQIIHDQIHAFDLAVGHLAQRGYSQIGFIGHDVHTEKMGRYVTRALENHALKLNSQWLMGAARSYFFAAGAYAAAQFLALPQALRPQAICSNNDEAANAFVAMLLRAHVQVPRDVALISLGDTDAARFAPVSLSSVSEPFRWQGERAVELLLSRLENPTLPPRVEWTRGELTVRDSTPNSTPICLAPA